MAKGRGGDRPTLLAHRNIHRRDADVERKSASSVGYGRRRVRGVATPRGERNVDAVAASSSVDGGSKTLFAHAVE